MRLVRGKGIADGQSTRIPAASKPQYPIKEDKFTKSPISRVSKVEICQSIHLYYIGQFIELVNVLGVIMHDLSFSTPTKP